MLARVGRSILSQIPTSPSAASGHCPGSSDSLDAPGGSSLSAGGEPGGEVDWGCRITAPAAYGDHDPEVKLLRRKHFPDGRRAKLTVDCACRNIGDVIREAQHPEPGHEASGTCHVLRHPAQIAQTPGAVVSVWGSASTELDRFAPYFSPKGINYDGEVSRIKHHVGVISRRGLKPNTPNQDDFIVLARDEFLFFGVLDGHGPGGHEVAHFVQEQLPVHIIQGLRADGDVWTRSVQDGFAQVMERLRTELPEHCFHSGSTVSVAMLDCASPAACLDGSTRPGAPASSPGGSSAGGSSPGGGPLRLRCAHLGDSLVVWAQRPGPGRAWEVTQLTDPHRPDREDEAERIARAGGRVTCATGLPRLAAGEWEIAMSRSAGDFAALGCGLSSEPEVAATIELDPTYQHMILACSDGVWDVIPPAQAVQFVGKFDPEEAQVAAERLVSKAQLRWQEAGATVDDITVILVRPHLEARN